MLGARFLRRWGFFRTCKRCTLLHSVISLSNVISLSVSNKLVESRSLDMIDALWYVNGFGGIFMWWWWWWLPPTKSGPMPPPIGFRNVWSAPMPPPSISRPGPPIRLSISLCGISEQLSDWFEPSAVTSHDTTRPSKQGSDVDSSAISSFTKLKRKFRICSYYLSTTIYTVHHGCTIQPILKHCNMRIVGMEFKKTICSQCSIQFIVKGLWMRRLIVN